MKHFTIRVMLVLAVTFGWHIHQIDMHNAFLNGKLQEEVYMTQPWGFVDANRPDYMCKLNKALYELKQAPKAWYEKLNAALLKKGLVNSIADSSLFF